MKKVTKEEFEDFIKNYPYPLETNFFMDWLCYYDFHDKKEIKSLDDLYSYKVAQKTECYCNEYQIKENADEIIN